MYSMEFTIQTHEGSYDLSAGVRLIGDDILIAIWGGERPAAAISIKPKSRTEGKICQCIYPCKKVYRNRDRTPSAG